MIYGYRGRVETPRAWTRGGHFGDSLRVSQTRAHRKPLGGVSLGFGVESFLSTSADIPESSGRVLLD